MKRPVGDEILDPEDMLNADMGTYSGYSEVPLDDVERGREFPIGFHVAAPGPAHTSRPRPKPVRKKKTPIKENGRHRCRPS